MKKQLIFLCALAVVTAACNVKESGQSTGLRLVTLTAGSDSPADTKTSYTNDGVFSWTENDKIAVYTDAEQFYSMELTGGAGTNTGTFTGEIEGTPSGYAVYPYLSTYPTYDGTTLSVYLPMEYDWSSDSYNEANNPMVGIVSGYETIAFKNLAGLLRISLLQVDADATKVTFYAGKKISGWFEVNLDNTDEPTILASDDESDEGVTFNFSELEVATNMIFYLPIPVGTYYFGFDVQDEDGNSLWKYTDIYTITVTRNELVIMPDLYRYNITSD